MFSLKQQKTRDNHKDPYTFAIESVFETLPFDAWFKDKNGRYVCVNKHFEEYAGKGKDEIIGKTDHDIYPKEEADIYVASDNAAISGRISNFFDSEYKTGKFKEEHKQPIFDQNGEFVGTAGISRDITDKVNVNQALHNSEKNFRAIFEEAPMGIGVFDTRTGQALNVNKMFCHILDRDRDEILKLKWQDYTYPDDIQENNEFTQKFLSSEISSFRIDKRMIKRDGTVIWVSLTVAPTDRTKVENSQHLCMIEDITDRKAHESEIYYLSSHDVLTGLYNRAFFESEKVRLDTEQSLPLSFIMGDINGLKLINDMFGHAQGDRLLIEMTEILKKCCRKDDMIA